MCNERLIPLCLWHRPEGSSSNAVSHCTGLEWEGEKIINFHITIIIILKTAKKLKKSILDTKFIILGS